MLDRAWEIGATNWDTANVYGDSEDLIGKWFKLHPERRADIFLATKFAGRMTENGFVFDSSPEHCRAAIKTSLERLGVDYVDLYYVHRLTKEVPIEKTVEAMAELVKEGKVRHLGLSECSSNSLRRAHAVHPIAAVQVEYNPWDLAIEGPAGTHLLKTCRELGVSVVCYSPLSRGQLTGAVRSLDDLEPGDFRRAMPRYSEENFYKNVELVDRIQEMARGKGCTAAQLTLAWLLAQGDDIIPIPGTKRIKLLEENTAAVQVKLSPEEVQRFRDEVEKANVQGTRTIPGLESMEYADTVEL